ncbi:MAG: HypC/HybG/HupF family hydrogenase formation chaperone [Candidatus Omnitrophica bacterium]|nr:HypC/HybG/HupF family hydrogenase formation chaperone [Candidatus Omnitrophota bacterium]
MCLAVPAEVKNIDKNLAFVDFGGVTKKVSIGILKDVNVGDYVLVHAGFAIGKLEKEEAQDTLKLLKEVKKALEDDQR